jgi:predicted phage terminase large subunit-like protein
MAVSRLSLDREATRKVLPALLRQRFDLFLRFVFREIAGSRDFQPGWHIEAMEHQLNRLDAGDNLQLVVTLPPRHLKSIIFSVAWVAWKLGRDPQTRFSCASYSYDLAEKHARDCLKVMESSWYRMAFPHLRLTKRALFDLETHAGGGRLATSVGGTFTGRGGDWIIIDDPMKADDALSEVERENVQMWFTNTLRQRADDERTRYIVVMQRLHEDDLAGYLLRKGGWEELRLSAIATRDERIALPGGRFHHRREGHAISPGRQSLAYLRQRQAEEPYVFAAQYQQDPVGRIGAFVKPEWFGTFDEPPRSGVVVMSCDTAVKTQVRSDWSVAIVARYYQNRFYILDVWRRRVEYSALLGSVSELCSRFGVERLLIEDASSGQQLIQQLRDGVIPGAPWPVAITPTTDKIVRFEAQASRIEGGQVVLPRSAPWLADFIAEVSRFPGARHDDQADALAQMLANPPLQLAPPAMAGPELMEETLQVEPRFADNYDPWGP